MKFCVHPLLQAALLCVACASAHAATCTAPSALEAQLHAHPDIAAYTEIGAWFQQNNQPSCAVDAYRAALKLDPKSRTVIYRLAQSLTAAGDPSSAIALLAKVPRDEEISLTLANAYTRAGRLDDAFQTLTRAVRADPASARVTGALVVFLAGQNQLDDAYRIAVQFAKLHPHELEAQKLYLRVLVAVNDANTARPLARKLLAAAPHDSELLYLNGTLERKAGDYPAAREHLQQAIALTPAYGESRYDMALVLAKLHDNAGAKTQFEKALALGVTEPEAHLEYSKTLQALGDTDAAQEQLQQYQLAMKVNTDREIATAKTTEADQALAAGDAAKAVAGYRAALDATPSGSTQAAATLQYKLSLALDRAGDMAAERAALEQAVQLDPRLAVAQHQLGYLNYNSGDYVAAAQHFRLAVEDDPAFTQAWISLAATLAASSRFADARDAAAHALRLDPHNAQALELKQRLTAAQSGH